MIKNIYLNLLFLFLILKSDVSSGQLTITSNDTTICAGTSLTLNSSHQGRTPINLNILDDYYSGIIPLGFNFTFYGNTYSQCVISSNGYISFNTSNANATSQYLITSAIPGNVATYNSILAAYADWNPAVGGSIDYATVGTAPNRKFVVTFCDVPFYGASCATYRAVFQAILYEGSNDIDIHLGRKPVCPLIANNNYTIQGLQNSNGTIAHFVPGRNWPFPWTAYHSSHRFTPTSVTNYNITAIPYAPIPNSSVPYSWYQNNVTLIASTPSITVSPTVNTFYTVRKLDCGDTLSDTVFVTVANAPISSTAFTNPSTCGGNNGSISLNGLTPNTVYTVNYSLNSVPQAPLNITSTAGGVVVIPNLSAGAYSAITATAGICATNPAGPITLTDPPTPAPPTASSNSPVCEGSTLNLTASTSGGGTYSWTGPSFTSGAQNPTIANVQAANAGMYSVTVTVNNCTSLPATTNVVVNPVPAAPVASSNSPVCQGQAINLTASAVAGATYNWTGPAFTSSVQNPTINNAQAGNAGTYSVSVTVNNCTSLLATTAVVVNPTPNIASTSFINPTGCNGTNGSITLTGLSNSTTYTLNYSKNAVPQAATSVTSGATGTVVITGLSAGTYTNIQLTLSGCTSNIVGPITLTDPANPTPPVVSNNGPLCAGATLNLTASAVAGATYSWTGPSFTSALQNPAIANVQTANAGVYSVTVTLNNCTSTPSTTTVVVNPVPVISSTSFINPTTCGGTNGSITLTGLQANTTYTVNYLNNSNPVSVSLTSSASGSITIAGLGAGTYTNITVTLNNCTSLPAGPITLTNPAIPAAPVVGSNSPVCEGQTINLTASAVAGATYSWTGPAFTSAVQNPTINNAQIANAGNYSVTVTVNNCTSLPANTNVVVNPTPNIASTSFVNPTGCNGTNGSITLTGLSNNTTYILNYTKNAVPQAATSVTSGATGTVVITGLSAGTYTNIQLTLSGCTSNIVGPITLSDPSNPTPPIASNNGPLCAGATLNLTASTVAGATYSWTGPSFTSALQNPTIANAQAANAGVYSVTVTLNNCTSVPSTTTVVINPVPATPTAGNNTPLCAGGTVNLTASTVAGATYSWSGPSFTSSLQNPAIANATAAASGVYSVTATINNCTSLAGTTPVTVHPIPAAPVVTPNFIYCQNSAAGPLIAAGQNLLWYTTATGGTGSSVTPIPSTATVGTFTWYVSQTVNGCESPRSAVSVDIITQPQEPVTTPLITYCQFDAPAQLTATGQNIQWYTQPTGGTPFTTAPTPSTTIAGTFHWYVTQSINNCESQRKQVTVVVNARPDTPLVNNPIRFCQDDPNAEINIPGQNLKWYTQPTGGTPSATAPVVNTVIPGTEVYYVSQTINGCEGDRSTVEITVNEKVFAAIKTDKELLCQFDTLLVSNTAVNPATASYNWNFSGATVISGSGEGPYKIMWASDGTKTITLTVTNEACTATDTKTLNPRPAPDASFVIREHACPNELITVQADWVSVNQAGYTWDFDGAMILNGTGHGIYKLKWNTPGEKIISLQINYNGCSSKPHYDTITVHENPAADIEQFSTDKICSGDEIEMRAKDLNTALTYNYLWTPQEFFRINGTQQVKATIKAAGYVYLQVTDPYGCSGKDSVFIPAQPCCDVYFPDAFTPNNDGRNDYFRIITQGHHQISNFRIVNRWGQTVFERANLQSISWDGTFNGEPQDMGTYYYFIRYNCNGEMVEKKGEVTLVR